MEAPRAYPPPGIMHNGMFNAMYGALGLPRSYHSELTCTEYTIPLPITASTHQYSTTPVSGTRTTAYISTILHTRTSLLNVDPHLFQSTSSQYTMIVLFDTELDLFRIVLSPSSWSSILGTSLRPPDGVAYTEIQS